MENTEQTRAPFFTISSESDLAVALMSLATYKNMMEKKDAPINRLEGEYLEALLKLMERTLPSANEQINRVGSEEEEDEEEYIEVDSEIAMNFHEAFGLLHSIVQTYYAMKRHIDLTNEQKAKLEPGFIEQVESLFNETKDNASDLLWRLTEKIYYTDYGLQTLELVFDKKLAIRPIQADKKKMFSTLTINSDNSKLFAWVFSQLNYLEYLQDTYVFARRMYSCQFFHIEDYKYIRDKLKDCKEGDVFDFSMYDSLCLYFSLSLCGLMFASDAADYLEDLEKEMKKEKDEMDISIYQVRNFFLKFSVQFLSEMKNKLKRRREFKKYSVIIDNWKL